MMIDQLWLGEFPSEADFSGKFKQCGIAYCDNDGGLHLESFIGSQEKWKPYFPKTESRE